MIDDPQTDASAISETETNKRLKTMRQAVLRLGGHGAKISAVLNGTVIVDGDMVDQLTDRKQHPSWQTIRAEMVPVMPSEEVLEKYWFGRYAEIRRDYDEDDIDGQDKANASLNRILP